jgi:hypothetical protein
MVYTRSMETLVTALFVFYILGMTAYAIWAERQMKEKDSIIDELAQSLTWFGYKENARDGDNDGIVQEGTKWERKVEKK